MATLILTTSCAPIKRPTDSSSHVNSATKTADDDHPSSAAVWSDSSSGSSGTNVKKTCSFTTGRHADNNASDNVGNFYGGNNSCHDVSSSVTTDSSSIVSSSHPQGKNGGNTNHRKSHRQHDVEFLQALPLQCDITILPRAHNDGDYLNATSLNYGNNNNSNNDGIMNNMIQPIRITQQRFHPCGVENIVRLAGVATTTTMSSSSSSLRNDDDKHDFILSLANCGVRIDNEGDDDRMKLPVQAVPSSFSFSTSSDTTPGYSYSGGEKHNVEEVAVSFDFSIAVDVYRQRFVANGASSSSSAATLDHNNQSWNEDGNAWKGTTAKDSTTTTNIKTMEIDSIMSTLEEESQFIKRTLVVLGSFGFGLLICMVWTIWKLERGRRARRRRSSSSNSNSNSNSRAVKRVFVDVPYEIIGTTTTTKSRGVTSLRSNPSLRSHGKAHFPEEISPIRSSVSLNEAEEEEVEKTTDDRLTAAASDDRKGVHETLHLITPQAETNSDGSSHSNEVKSSSSPRHWYEDFLSPRGCSKKKKTPNNRSDTLLFSEKEEVARSLFCSSSRSSSSNNNKVSPRMDNEESFHKSKSKSAVSSLVLNAPKKKVIVSPIERSSLSPPPRSDVSLLKLSQDIESSKSSPLMVSTETEETLASSKTDEDGDELPSSIEVTHKKEESCTISPVSVATTKESSGTNKPVGVLQVNTPKPKRSRTLKTPAADNISISSSSEESQFSTSQKTRKSFAEELAKKARMTPISTKSDFSRSIARRAAEVQTPKKTLKPLSASSSPPDDEPSPFLADYW